MANKVTFNCTDRVVFRAGAQDNDNCLSMDGFTLSVDDSALLVSLLKNMQTTGAALEVSIKQKDH